MVERKYLILGVVAVACFATVAWKLNSIPTPQSVNAGDSVQPNSSQPAIGNQSSQRVATPESSNSSGSIAQVTGKSPTGSEASGTLNDQIERTFATGNGAAAAQLAGTLKDCDLNRRSMESDSRRGAPANLDPAVQAVRAERLQQYQRLEAACQTVPGDQNKMRLRLLDLAVQQGVVGAATDSFEAGSREPQILAHVVSDAALGDVRALATVAMYDAKLFNISQDDQDAARYALKLATSDAEIGPKVINWFKIAESYGAPNSKFNFSEISQSARSKGEETARRIKQRLAGKLN